MAEKLDRRAALKVALSGAAAGLAGLSLSPLVAAADAKASARKVAPATTQITDKVFVVSGIGGNVVVLAGEDGQLLVDSGASAHARALTNQLRALPGRGHVHTLFNTHWHPEQTGSNEALAKGGAKIIAHEKTKLWLGTDRWLPGEMRYEKARPKQALPTETFFTKGTTSIGGEEIEYGYLLEAHTDGDIYVYFRNSNVLAVGDVASPEQDPVLDWFGGGWLGGRLDAQKQLLALANDQTRIVAGTGAVITRAQLEEEHGVTQKVFERMHDMIRKGMSWMDMYEAGALDGLSRTWSDPQKFCYDAHKGLWAHHNHLSHDVV